MRGISRICLKRQVDGVALRIHVSASMVRSRRLCFRSSWLQQLQLATAAKIGGGSCTKQCTACMSCDIGVGVLGVAPAPQVDEIDVRAND